MSTSISSQLGPARRVLSILVLALVGLAPALVAERLIPFQGRVVGGDGQPLPDGVYRVTFAIYDSQTGGGALNGWIESHENVSIIGGQINVLLGSLTSLDDPNNDSNTSDAISFAGSGSNPVGPRYLGIKIGEATNQEMVPRHELVPTFHARMADRVARGGITTDQLADGAVTTLKMAPDAGVPVGAVVMWWGELAAIPEGFEICDGTLPTTPGALLTGSKPDLRDRFPLGAGGSIAPTRGETGGDSTSTTTGSTILTEAQMAAHRHTGGTHNHFDYGGVTPNQGQCQIGPGITGDPFVDGQSYRRVLGYQGPTSPQYINCPADGVDFTFPVAGADAIVDAGPRGEGHTHTRPPIPAYVSLYFIVRVK